MSDWLHGVRVPPMRIDELREIATVIRQQSELSPEEPFPVLKFLEWSMDAMFEDFDFEVVDTLPDGDEARAYPDGAPHHPNGPVIQLLRQVYEGAGSNNGRSRLTVLHECAHVILHGHVAVHHRGPRGAELKPWVNSEWQANQLAVELLMTVESFKLGMDLESYVAHMGVSREAACNRALQLERTLGLALPVGWPVHVYASSKKHKGGIEMSP